MDLNQNDKVELHRGEMIRLERDLFLVVLDVATDAVILRDLHNMKTLTIKANADLFLEALPSRLFQLVAPGSAPDREATLVARVLYEDNKFFYQHLARQPAEIAMVTGMPAPKELAPLTVEEEDRDC